MKNRRAADRFEVEVVAEVEIDGEVFEGTTHDVSSSGVRVLLNTTVDEGSAVLLTLILTEDGIEDPDEDPFEAEATVMWAAPSDTSGVMLGLRFSDVAADQASRLKRFLAAIDRAPRATRATRAPADAAHAAHANGAGCVGGSPIGCAERAT